MNLKLVNSRLAVAVVVGLSVLAVSEINTEAAEIKHFNIVEPYTIYVDSYDTTNTSTSVDTYLTAISEQQLTRAFAEMEEFAYVRIAPDIESEWIGKLYPKNLVTILETDSSWSKIISGNVQGYVETEVLVIGEEAQLRMNELQQRKAKVTVNVLNVRTGPGTDHSVIGTVTNEDILEVLDVDMYSPWIEVKYNDAICFVYGEYLEIEELYTFGETKGEEQLRLEEERIAKEQANKGITVVDFAKQYIGNPYVWGGTSLTNGADCSGFVQSIFRHFGISLPRTSAQQRTAGVSIPYVEAKPGDIICYSGHVGIYAGNDEIVNALNSKKGIVLSNAKYKEILSVRRVL